MALFVMKRYWGENDEIETVADDRGKPDSRQISNKKSKLDIVSDNVKSELDKVHHIGKKNSIKAQYAEDVPDKHLEDIQRTFNEGVRQSKLSKNNNTLNKQKFLKLNTSLGTDSSNSTVTNITADTALEEEQKCEFTVLGRVKENKLPEVQRVLPHWLRNPDIISPDIAKDQKPLISIPKMSENIRDSLKKNGINFLFPVQLHIIPEILGGVKYGLYNGRAGRRPRDLCCSAPTGSGKTLSFVLPIIQVLQDRIVPQVRCLVVLPVIDLATQVYKVFKEYSKFTKLKIALLTGKKSYICEQNEIIEQRHDGFHSLVDIIVATPGRLVDHINSTRGFSLRHLRFLVIDEADRIIKEVKQDWLETVNRAVIGSEAGSLRYTSSHNFPSRVLTVANSQKMDIPFRKLIFSATLSQNPEILHQLDLFQPRLFVSKRINAEDTSSLLLKSVSSEDGKSELDHSRVVPKELKELYCVLTPATKLLAMVYLLKVRKYSRMLCFTKSLLSANRLALVLRKIGGITVKVLSSEIDIKSRTEILSKFAAGNINIIVCTDAFSRGIDFRNVSYVVSYDSPCHYLTYIHRIGRTARAGKAGTAITFVTKREVAYFLRFRKKCGGKIRRLVLNKLILSNLTLRIEAALNQSKLVMKKSKSKNKFKKANYLNTKDVSQKNV